MPRLGHYYFNFAGTPIMRPDENDFVTTAPAATYTGETSPKTVCGTNAQFTPRKQRSPI